MPVPDTQTLFLPLLQLFADAKEHRSSELVQSLAEHFKLTVDELAELLPSGLQKRFSNRVAWATVHLKMAGLLVSVSRGAFRITDNGQATLARKLERINLAWLSANCAGYDERRNRKRKLESPADARKCGIGGTTESETPQEALERGHEALRERLADELLDKVKSCTPAFFERLVVDLLVAMGYGGSRQDAGKVVGGSGDGGIDGIIKEDKLGLDALYIQAKRWEAAVGRPVVQSFAGSMEAQRARKGVLITTSRFSKDAHDYVAQIEKKIVLMDGEQLVEHMINCGLGVSTAATYTVHRLDLDYFEEEV